MGVSWGRCDTLARMRSTCDRRRSTIRSGGWIAAWLRHPWVALVVLLAIWMAPGDARANPDLRWRTIETEHFFVHYHAGNEEAAERTAQVAERAYDRLSIAWGHDVFLKTHVTLIDDTDTANGRATAVPYPQILAYTTAPEALSVLDAYDDWLDILITHELVHVIHLDTAHGLYRLINAVLGFGVLGKLTAPNILQPRWIVEGVATHHESVYTSQGRQRSAQFDAYIRMAVIEGTFQNLDQISSGARVFPHGTSVYLYGLHFMYYIATRYGEDKLRELSHIYATQLVPFGINKAIEKVLGVTFYQLWKEFKRDTVRRFEAQVRRIRSRGLRQGRRLTFSGETTRYPAWSDDDRWIYFFKNDGHREEGIKRIASTGGRVREGVGIGRQGTDVDIEHVLDAENVGASSFIAGSQDIVFDQTRAYDLRYNWSDLYRWNGGDPFEAEQLTFGRRASEPHVSSDGRKVVFRRNDVAQSRLGFLDLHTGDVVEAEPLGRIAQVYTPRWSPDGTKVAFSGWQQGGYRDIYLYEPATGALERITADRFMDQAPSWSPDGETIVFSSDRDGVFNIYAYDLGTRRIHQVSNVLGGAFEPRISHDGTKIAYVGFNSEGFDLWVMPYDRDAWLEAMPPVSDLPEVPDPKPELEGQAGRSATLQSTRYQPIKTMYPRTIFPTALDFSSSQFGTGLGFETGVRDHLGFHDLLFNFNYLIDERIATGRVVYTYARLFPTFRLTAARGYSQRVGFVRYLYDRESDQGSYRVEGYRERSTLLDATMSIPVLRHPRHGVSASVGYRWERWTNLDADDAAIDPNAPLTQLPEVGDATRVDVGLGYSSTGDGFGRFTYGTERGRAASFNIAVLDERLGGDFGDIQATASYVEIIPMPWRGHQSLDLSLRGGVSAGGLARRGAFCVSDFAYGGDIIRGLLNRQGFGTGCSALLRGYPARGQPGGPGLITGRYFGVFSANYRIPILDIDRGIGTLPFFVQRIGLIPFVDWGAAWTDPIDVEDLLVGAGASMIFSFRLGYAEGINLVLQYAHGFDDELGADTFRALVTTSF